MMMVADLMKVSNIFVLFFFFRIKVITTYIIHTHIYIYTYNVCSYNYMCVVLSNCWLYVNCNPLYNYYMAHAACICMKPRFRVPMVNEILRSFSLCASTPTLEAVAVSHLLLLSGEADTLQNVTILLSSPLSESSSFLSEISKS